MKLADLTAKRVAVLGAGVEGLAAWRALVETSHCEVFSESAAENAPPEMTLHVGPLSVDHLRDFDVIIKSPGISLYRPELLALQEYGTTITSGTRLFFDNRPSAKVIAITGTKGKSTVTSLVTHLIKAAGRHAEIGGNHGRPLIELVSSEADVIVAELSSYQTADMVGHVDVALLTNLYPEHLDWHGSMEQYAWDKLRLFKDADIRLCRKAERDQYEVLNSAMDYLTECSWTRDGEILMFRGERVEHEFPLRGTANLDNLLAALNAAEAAGVDCRYCIESLADFSPLAHRQQIVREAGDVLYVDDSIATTPHATRAALDAFGDRAIGLIVGGFERGVEWHEFAMHLAENPIAFIAATGQNGARILDEVAKHAPNQPRALAKDLAESINLVRPHLGMAGTVLLSPGAPSYGQYRNYAERGDAFASLGARVIEPSDVLEFWFGSPIAKQDALWWRGGDVADAKIRSRFGEAVQRALAGELEYWKADSAGCVALIIVLDQFTRNMFRGTADAFAGDALARQACLQLLSSGTHKNLHPLLRIFSYMPLEHSENLDDQERCIALFQELEREEPDWAEYVADNTRYARDHRDIIARFGRFPHRNQALERVSTEEEREYLESGGRRFGQ